MDKITHDGRTYIFGLPTKAILELVQWLIEKNARADNEDAHGYSVLICS